MQPRRQLLLSLQPLIFLSTAFSFASCHPLANHAAPTLVTELELRQSFAAAGQGENQRIVTNWLSTLQDERITQVVTQALANNPDLKVAATRLRSAREGAIIGRSALLPSVTGSTRGGLSRSDGEAADSYGLSLNVSWEPDLWGRLRDLKGASYADYEAAVADFRSARLSLAINTAQSWCNLITAEKQLVLAQETLVNYEKNFRIIERGYKAGILRPLDVNFGRNNIAANARNLRARELARNEAARALELILGTYPAASLTTSADLPSVPRQVRAGLPIELVERRPDLASRRANLLASGLRADAARKSLLPNLRLTGSTGTSSTELREILNPGNLASSVAASLAQNFYSGEELQARARQGLLQNQAQIDLYVSNLLIALREVESALDNSTALADQEVFLEKEAQQATLAERFAEGELIQGTAARSETQVLELLESQRRADNARASLIALRNRRIQNHLDLLLALGGSI